MRRLVYSCVRVVVMVSVVFTLAAAPAEFRRALPREKDDPVAKVVKAVKKVIRSLSDGLTTPTP